MPCQHQSSLVLLAIVATFSSAWPRPASAQPSRAGIVPGSPCDLGPQLSKPAVRFVVIGDFGDPHPDGRDELAPEAAEVLEAIGARHADPSGRFDFGLTVGDNFYPSGVESLEAARRRWKPYATLGIPFFATLGNHDYAHGHARNQVRYGGVPLAEGATRTWNMPCGFYTFEAGPARFVALDTDEGTTGFFHRLLRFRWFSAPAFSAFQTEWLRLQLERDTRARWTFVYGHHPVYSWGEHGNTSRLHRGAPSLVALLERYNVAGYLAGHDHDLQHIAKARSGASAASTPSGGSGTPPLQFFVVGGGGRGLRPVRCPTNDQSCRFAKSSRGFLEVDVTEQSVTYTFRDAQGACLHKEPGPCP